jgi:hypothetical protein
MSSTGAMSRSTGPFGAGGGFLALSRFDLRNPDFRAESAALIWDWSADRVFKSAGLEP